MVGTSRPIRELRRLIQLFAPSDEAVLITGESGTGKELVARELHRASGREGFVAVDCGSIPPSLAAPELFGHVKGAFTDARRDRSGLFASAGRGTLFLDEVAELPAEVQAGLLRALDPGEFSPVGSTKVLRREARLIAATNRPVAPRQATWLRPDLFNRLGVLRIHVPPLRERRQDIPVLARHFLNGRPITPAALTWLDSEDWRTGNVRELRSVLVRASLLADGDPVAPKHLESYRAVEQTRPTDGDRPTPERTLEAASCRHIQRVLAEEGGNRSRAAAVLDIDPKTLRRWIRKCQRRGGR
jgi:DNA-binding NtrC family response regulator